MSARSGLLAVLSGLVLVGLVCGLAWLGLTSGQAKALANSSTGAVTNAPGGPPDLTGYWRNKPDTVSPPWHLVASNSLLTLDATWTGGAGHTGLHGSFHGSLFLTGGVYEYDGSFYVTETGNPNPSSGSATFTIDNANQIRIDFQGANPQHYVFVRVGASAEIVPQPASGATEAVQSPSDLPATATSASVDVSSSSGNLSGDAVAAGGDVETFQQTKTRVGQFVAFCWLTYDFKDKNGNVKNLSPAQQLIACSALARLLIIASHRFAVSAQPLASPNALALQSGAVPLSAANRGCRELVIPIGVRTSKGRIVSIGKAKHASLTASSVRYSCSVSGGTVKITIKGHKSLRKSLGKRLQLLVVRATKAPPASGTLTFTFGR